MSDKLKISVPNGKNFNPVTTLLYNTIQEANKKNKIGINSQAASPTQMDIFIPKDKKAIVEKAILEKATILESNENKNVRFAAKELKNWAQLINKTV